MPSRRPSRARPRPYGTCSNEHLTNRIKTRWQPDSSRSKRGLCLVLRVIASVKQSRCTDLPASPTPVVILRMPSDWRWKPVKSPPSATLNWLKRGPCTCSVSFTTRRRTSRNRSNVACGRLTCTRQPATASMPETFTTRSPPSTTRWVTTTARSSPMNRRSPPLNHMDARISWRW